MARRKVSQLTLPIAVAVYVPGPGAPTPDWRPGESIAEDHYAGPPLPEPKKKRIPVRHDRPACPQCGPGYGVHVEEHHEPGRWNGPRDADLFCPACGSAWKASEAEIAQARRAERASQRHEKAEETRAENFDRYKRECRQVSLAAQRYHLAQVVKKGHFKALCGVEFDDPTGRDFAAKYLLLDVPTTQAWGLPNCQGCLAAAPADWRKRLEMPHG